jgi:hypothetical protein
MKKSAIILSSIVLSLALSVCKGQALVLPTEADVWGSPQTITLNGGSLQLRTKFIKHFGTTCVFNIEFTNTGNVPISEEAQLTKQGSPIYTHWSTSIKLKQGEVAIFQMERRECSPIFGKKKQKNISKCAECNPTISFLKK